METKVLQQVIDKNRGIQNEIIRDSKFFYCCKSLQTRIKKYFNYLLTIFSLSLVALIIGYPIYLYNSDSIYVLIAPFAFQILLLAIQILILLISILNTKPKLIKMNLVLSILNFAYSFIIMIVSNIFEVHTFSGYTGLRFGIQIPCSFLLFISISLSGFLIASVRRFLILVKQLDQIEFTINSCI
ncbi:transmembrane protein, putative (macronuclear) [Tetrahymena thermophila SB210]|uniref:Transmembrane protein, putative n=1 Tax=Tetrahymena thermophila (strain SB210) TaxID=312017 RepID=W7XKS3_TETTS|nr:transmembrane protein, putative [Tetrahymena thermophila SB210]EWS75159.1 transmembrane protein, putative [Tetrahymena thermophila SB210]|eukprot:XP_012652315.1 transmembrane protein, putative [Tetrahymena thermophila SB210]